MVSSKTPSPPVFTPPPAAPQYTPPPNPEKTVPQVMTAPQVVSQGMEAEAFLPSWLQLTQENQANPLHPDVLKQYEDNYFAQNVNPQIAAAEAQIGTTGQQYSSYGGGLVGQLRSQGQLDKFSAGLGASQQAYNNLLQGRQSLYAGGIGLAQDQGNLNVQRGLGIADLQSNNAANENQFNQGIYGIGSQNTGYQNSFNQANYANSLQAMQKKDQQKFNQTLGIGQLGMGAIGLGTQAFGALKNSGAFGLPSRRDNYSDFGLGSNGIGNIR